MVTSEKDTALVKNDLNQFCPSGGMLLPRNMGHIFSRCCWEVEDHRFLGIDVFLPEDYDVNADSNRCDA